MLGDFPNSIHVVSGKQVKTTGILGIGTEKYQWYKPRIMWEEGDQAGRGCKHSCMENG